MAPLYQEGPAPILPTLAWDPGRPAPTEADCPLATLSRTTARPGPLVLPATLPALPW